MPAGEFKARCLAVMEDVNKTREPVLITKRGRPIAKLVALSTQFPDNYSRDPADRLIGATARAEGLSLVTRDENIGKSPLLHTIW